MVTSGSALQDSAVNTASRRYHRRPTPGYSLDEVARIRRAITRGEEHIRCPDCHHELDPRVGRNAETAIWVVRCHVCGRGVVMYVEGDERQERSLNAQR
jgi:ribosomal protein L37AE/L43A